MATAQQQNKLLPGLTNESKQTAAEPLSQNCIGILRLFYSGYLRKYFVHWELIYCKRNQIGRFFFAFFAYFAV